MLFQAHNPSSLLQTRAFVVWNRTEEAQEFPRGRRGEACRHLYGQKVVERPGCSSSADPCRPSLAKDVWGVGVCPPSSALPAGAPAVSQLLGVPLLPSSCLDVLRKHWVKARYAELWGPFPPPLALKSRHHRSLHPSDGRDGSVLQEAMEENR